MKRIQAIATSVAVMMGASGAAMAQSWRGDAGRQESGRNATQAVQVYQAARHDNDGFTAVENRGRADRYDDMRAQHGRSAVESRTMDRDRDQGNAWQYRDGDNDRNREIAPLERVRIYHWGKVQPRVDADHDRF
ncbi:MAG TPA: hypothetical protein VE998_12590 [Terriglobales bacterium]|nr:hypothetical protein [Terriglobales bacterium]